MPVIAVINRKGGSGKSTLATHLAGHCASAGLRAMLGDTDRQQSTQAWLRARAAQTLPGSKPIVGWAIDPKNSLRPPVGVTHVVLDTPGGTHGFELAKVVSYADAVLIPVCQSMFDREAAAECYAELKTLPRVANGRCKVAAIGMRLDGRTKAGEVLARWAAEIDLPYVGALRETQTYVRCVEHGLTIFDLPASQTSIDRAQWQPILDWLDPVLRPLPAAAETPALKPTRPCAVTAERRPASLTTVSTERSSAPVAHTAPHRPAPGATGQVPLGILQAAPRRGVAQRVAEWLRVWPMRQARRA
ncbi:ParA family protein [uncultured Methylibium sp.]|uniref:ParA family protein n=1 Tax=uncultured Methylibium sp. TaxID=381093 RepID=UPI0025CD3259|nr:ParA family protein [uncultured Methylibium sp.]